MEQSNVVGETEIAPQRPVKRSSAGWKALAIIGCIMGTAGLIIGGIALTRNLKGKVGTQGSGDGAGYYGGTNAISVADAAEKIAPAVVSVITEDSQGQSGTGTGIIVSRDGYVMTNRHVAEGMQKLAVELDNGDYSEQVQFLGADPLTDIAFLKISGLSDLPVATIGDSKNNLVGMPVLAIGYAKGTYPNTVTMGIISGLERQVTANTQSGEVYETLTDLIQTDAAINPGNSGGALVNAAGEVIGVNVASDVSAQGISFAVPIAAAKGMLRNVVENGRAKRADMGLSYAPITSQVAYERNLPVRHGALVIGANGQSGVASNGPAAKAGLKDGDIITAVNGTDIGRKGSLLTLVSEHMPGETVALAVLRGSQKLNLNMTLGIY